jgi:hypothetical protein
VVGVVSLRRSPLDRTIRHGIKIPLKPFPLFVKYKYTGIYRTISGSVTTPTTGGTLDETETQNIASLRNRLFYCVQNKLLKFQPSFGK